MQLFRRSVLYQKLFLISARVGGTLDFLIVVKINFYKAEFLLLEKIEKNICSAVFGTLKLVQEKPGVQNLAL